MFTIEKASVGFHFFERPRYPFKAMEVGDSFFIDDFRLAESARVSAINFVKRNDLDWRFCLRKIQDGWRVVRVN